MTKNRINFKKERDFGDLFNATFNFITQEYKRLATAILYIVVPWLLLAAIAMSVYSLKSQELTQSIAETQTGTPDPFAVFSVMGALWGYIAIALIISLIATAILLGTVYSYVKLYIQNNPEGFTIFDVWQQAKKHFLTFTVATFLIGLVVGIGFVFCLIPGIYLGVALSIVLCIMIFEEKDFSSAFGRSIRLINKNWWQTFAVIIIATIILYVLMIFISLPSMLFSLKSVLTNVKSGQPITNNLSIGYYIFSTITQTLTQILLVIPILLSAFIYYSIVEKVEKLSLMTKIAQINDNE
jgi:hypothetical protein